jgi:hypothetical protein
MIQKLARDRVRAVKGQWLAALPTRRREPCPRSYIDFPTFEMIELIWPPRKMSATIATIAIKARMRAYSASPCPRVSSRQSRRIPAPIR